MADPIFIGIDYGARKVAIAAIDVHQRLRELVDLSVPASDRDGELLVISSFATHAVQRFAGRGHASIEAAILGASLNASTLANLGYSAGALCLSMAMLDIPTQLVPSATWKKVALGNGAAKKDDVMAWARETFTGTAIATQDQADALGLAMHARTTWITHHEGEE